MTAPTTGHLGFVGFGRHQYGVDARTVRWHKAFTRAVACELSRAFYGVVLELKNQKLRTCMERLADWLLRANAKLGDKGQFTIPDDKRTHASRLGMTSKNLSRNLRSVADWGCVVIHGRDVTLGDPAALAAIAGSVAPDTEINF